MMRILHTSDWHLGQHFFTKNRAQEHRRFIDWLVNLVEQNQINAVVIAGDLFDTGTPPSYAREIYYDCVAKLNNCGCQLVVLAGNHDSVAMLNESKGVLGYLNTHVVAAPDETPDQQIIPLYNKDQTVGALLCAIPFLRPRDVMSSLADLSATEKSQALGQAITAHYQAIYAAACRQRDQLGKAVPIIATGHLTALGVKTSDAVRDVYIGTLEAFPSSEFPPADYIALGHIHRPQKVGGTEHIRYCGSPIPLAFDELKSTKQVVQVTFSESESIAIEPINVPRFQPMAIVRGNLESLPAQLKEASRQGSEALPVWLCIEVSSDQYVSDLQQRIETMIEGLPLEILQVKRLSNTTRAGIQQEENETLAELSPFDVFARRLALEPELVGTPLETELTARFEQVVEAVLEETGIVVTRPTKKPAAPAESLVAELEGDLFPLAELPSEPPTKPKRRSNSAKPAADESQNQVDLFAGGDNV
ncbi:exonuclease subunit SbcD [Neptunomonas sp. XY-337]|uniref:exonuclease subunit SbcD n=1 Tax=Neptunomonas sp. XY-337 TaxID=2561897 RepID=UPI001F0F74FD|nr:exonuclease subunit SbcD [Neptunomonas sp. XY-337]